ncbi:MAG: T9SS type A sorting domain-containing protein [Chryseolinea sp.]
MRFFNLLVLAILLPFVMVQAQSIDSNFQSPLPLRSAFIQDIKVLSNGKILLGGSISYYGTKRVFNLIRLNADGSLDETFSFNHEGDIIIMDIEVLNSGDLLVLTRGWESARSQFTYGDSYVLLLSADGTQKNEIQNTAPVTSMTIQDDDHFLVCSENVGGGYLHRYNTTSLTEDVAFNSSITSNSTMTDVAVYNGKIFVSGTFSMVNGVAKNDIVKLNLDGSVDNSFDTGAGTEDYIGRLSFQTDGKILPGRTYINSFNGTTTSGLIRLNTDGSLDQTFQAPYLNGGASKSVVSGDKIYFAAATTIDGITQEYLLRLNSNGSLDATFEPVPVSEFGSFEIKIALAGNDVIINNSALNGNIFGLSKYEANGNRVMNFKPEVSRFGTLAIGDYLDEKLLVAGDFIRMNGVESFGIARLNLDGSLDESFKLPTNKGVVRQVEILDSENILVSTYAKFFKLNASGEVRPEFNFEHFKNLYQIIKFKTLDNGKIIASDPNGIYRLNANGSEDTSFDIGEGNCCVNSTAFDFDLQIEKVIYGSAFTQFNTIDANKLVRLNTNASVDQIFNIGVGPDNDPYSVVSMIKVLDTNEILIGGYFSQFDGVTIPHGLVKLSENGSLNTTFNDNQQNSPGPGEVSLIGATVDQLVDKIIIRQPNFNSLYVLNLDGTVDPDFTIPTGVELINDIITFDPDITNGRVSKNKDSNKLMFALGSFKKTDNSDPSFLLKLIVGGDGGVPTGIEDPHNSLLQMNTYPSPASEFLKIKFKEAQGNFRITLYDVSGKQHLESFFSKTNEADVADIDLRNTPSGLYLVKVTSSSGKMATVKVSVIK